MLSDGVSSTELRVVAYDQFGNAAADDTTVPALRAQLQVEVESPPDRVFVGLRGGYLTNFGQLSAPMGSLVADVRLPMLDDNFWLGAEAAFAYADLSGVSDHPVRPSMRAIRRHCAGDPTRAERRGRRLGWRPV